MTLLKRFVCLLFAAAAMSCGHPNDEKTSDLDGARWPREGANFSDRYNEKFKYHYYYNHRFPYPDFWFSGATDAIAKSRCENYVDYTNSYRTYLPRLLNVNCRPWSRK